MNIEDCEINGEGNLVKKSKKEDLLKEFFNNYKGEGLTALSTAGLFLLSIFLLPLFAFIPSAAAASALIYVGVLMMANVKDIDFKNIKYAVPAFVTIIVMVLAYSITDGIGAGIVTFAIIDFIIWLIDLIRYKKGSLKEKPKLEITVVTLIIFILFMIYFLVPTVL